MSITDSQIRARIEQHDDPGHEDANTVEEVRTAWADIQSNLSEYLGEFADELAYIAYEDDDILIFEDTQGDSLTLAMDEVGIEGDIMHSILNGLMTDVARKKTEYDWGGSWPVVINKPGAFRRGERHVEHRVGQIAAAGCSEAAALDYWMVEVKGWSQSAWADYVGKAQQTVSENIQKAKDAIKQQR